MLETALALLAAHVFADFLFQFGWIVDHKRHPGVFVVHVLIVGAIAALVLGWIPSGPAAAGAVAVVTLSHALIDACKTWIPSDAWLRAGSRRDLKLFFADQAAHGIFILLAAWWFPSAWAAGFWASNLPEAAPDLLVALTGVAGFILATRTGGFVIRMFMAGFEATKAPVPDAGGEGGADTGLPEGGAWIGLLERALIFVLILFGQIQAIGFLIAAKSVLRFEYARSHSEYVIIGTLASFGWAIVFSSLTVRAIEYLS